MKKGFAFLLVIALLMSLCACDSSDYKKAADAMEAGDYSSALPVFETLGDYKDSAARATECRYQLALADLSSGSFEKAIEAFEALGSFADSAERAAEARIGLVKQKIVGKWSSEEIDITDQVKEVLTQTEFAEFFEYITLSRIALRTEMELTDKGTYSASVNEEEFSAFVEQLIEDVAGGLTKYVLELFEESLAEEGYTMQDLYDEVGTDDPDEIFSSLEGMSAVELLKSMNIEGLMGAIASVTVNGTYEVTGEELLLHAGTATEHAVYSPAEDTITILSAEQDGSTDMTGYPKNFIRAN